MTPSISWEIVLWHRKSWIVNQNLGRVNRCLEPNPLSNAYVSAFGARHAGRAAQNYARPTKRSLVWTRFVMRALAGAASSTVDSVHERI